MANETLGELLARAAGDDASGLRFLDRRERARFASWAEIETAARAVAGALRRLGLGPGERAALIFGTGEAFFHALFGVVLAGAVPVPLYPPVRLGRLEEYHHQTARMLRAASCRLVLAEPRIKRLLGETVARARPALGCRSLDELPAAPAVSSAAAPDDLALVQYSSGTTAEPKPVALSHRAIAAQVRALNDHWRGDEPRASGVSWLPLYHDMGLIGCVFTALELPGVVTLIPPELFVARPAIWLRAIGRFRASISVAPNFAYALCTDKIADRELDGVDLSAWRVALNGAEPVAPGVLRAFARRFAKWGLDARALTPVYGLSEAALAVTFSDLERPFRSACFDRLSLFAERRAAGVAAPAGEAAASAVELVSLGRPLPGFALRIAGEGGEELPAGRVGRVLVRGPSLMSGYLDQPAATAAVLRDGWLDTGDLGFVDGGELFLTGRAKDLIILRGRNHAPQEIEQAVYDVAGVRRGCVVALGVAGAADATERLLLFVERAKDAAEETVAALPAACTAAVLARTGLRPDEVRVLAPGTLPRTSSGKLRRRETLARYLAGTLDPPRPVGPLRLAGALARSAWAYARGASRETS
ncbi:MAG: fatty acyl-AMP ligase [Acidobacteria bacterium]|nr:MAG: fatty acyl-AMP ligase [Acidobacteriota bacterium]